jgi:hypothetical protein
MKIKEDLKALVEENLRDKASTIFLKRSANLIDASGDDKDSIALSVRKVGNLIAFFIDEALAEIILGRLMERIDESRDSESEMTAMRRGFGNGLMQRMPGPDQ